VEAISGQARAAVTEYEWNVVHIDISLECCSGQADGLDHEEIRLTEAVDGGYRHVYVTANAI
jgi:hypothetical protein